MPVFDAHLHIIDDRFPLIANHGYLPERFSVAQYLERIKPLDIDSGAVVSGSFQGFDQSYLVSALEELNKNKFGSNVRDANLVKQFVGVTQLPHIVSDAELAELNKAGVRAIRFNLYRGGSETVDYLESMARRVFDLFNWHVELYISAKGIIENRAIISRLPMVSIDHIGMERESFDIINNLVEQGVKIKATGFGRVNFDPVARLRFIHDINPAALMFGTDLPSTRAAVPFANDDLEKLRQVFSDDDFERISYSNAREFYRISSPLNYERDS